MGYKYVNQPYLQCSPLKSCSPALPFETAYNLSFCVYEKSLLCYGYHAKQ